MIGVDRGSKRVQKEPIRELLEFSNRWLQLQKWFRNFCDETKWERFVILSGETVSSSCQAKSSQVWWFRITTSKRMFTVLWETIIYWETKKRFQSYSLQKNVRNSIMYREIFYILWDLLYIVRLAAKHHLLILENSDLIFGIFH